MEKQTFDLNKMGLAALSNSEMHEVEGGGLPTWLKGFGIAWLADQIISNWDEIKQGAKEGWNSVHYN